MLAQFLPTPFDDLPLPRSAAPRPPPHRRTGTRARARPPSRNTTPPAGSHTLATVSTAGGACPGRRASCSPHANCGRNPHVRPRPRQPAPVTPTGWSRGGRGLVEPVLSAKQSKEAGLRPALAFALPAHAMPTNASPRPWPCPAPARGCGVLLARDSGTSHFLLLTSFCHPAISPLPQSAAPWYNRTYILSRAHHASPAASLRPRKNFARSTAPPRLAAA